MIGPADDIWVYDVPALAQNEEKPTDAKEPHVQWISLQVTHQVVLTFASRRSSRLVSE